MKNRKIIKYVIKDIARSRAVAVYFVLLLVASSVVVYSTGDTSRGTISLLNIVLLVVPLFTVIYSLIHVYNSHEMIETMLVFPVRRSKIFSAYYTGLSLTLSVCVILGLGIPFLVNGFTDIAFYLLYISVFLTLIFTAFAFLITSLVSDKTKGIGISLICWLYFAVIYDLLVVAFYIVFSDYPLETATIVFTMLNPVDLARIFILLKTDVAVLMGYTGAVLAKFFGTLSGIFLTASMMIIWFLIPYLTARMVFNKKDF
ncbi:MAG: ABC transporter permease [Ignavibacteria bacterium]|nr:ABC transporter permease [Ignavibacteria bacterium]